MVENQFIVDLGTLKLTDKQRESMNAAIHKAVVGELATIDTGNKIALLPLTKFPSRPIFLGLVIRELNNKFDEFLK